LGNKGLEKTNQKHFKVTCRIELDIRSGEQESAVESHSTSTP